MRDVLIVVNPASGGGRTGRQWEQTARTLRGAGLEFDAALTSGPGDAVRLARQAVREGRPVVVAAGGDGTISEVVNGFFEDGRRLPGDSALGVLPMGTGGDFRRTFGFAIDHRAAALTIQAGHRRRIDAGRVTYTVDGGSQSRVFINIADAGLGGDVADRVNRGRRIVNGEVTFLYRSVLGLLGWRNRPMRVDADGDVRQITAQQVVVANCRFYGGGMMIAPDADPGDGLLDVILLGDLSLVESVRGLGPIRSGQHFSRRIAPGKLHHLRARRVEVTSGERVLVDSDGEQPGCLPAVFEVLPSVIDLVCPLT